jgi:threonine/homoserine/homoserine lactone efflux protein
MDAAGQLAVLAVMFVVVLAAVDVATTLAVARARATFATAHRRLLEGVSGVLLMLGGAALAAMRRP